jgi:hypothetical protein
VRGVGQFTEFRSRKSGSSGAAATNENASGRGTFVEKPLRRESACGQQQTEDEKLSRKKLVLTSLTVSQVNIPELARCVVQPEAPCLHLIGLQLSVR